MGDGERQHDGNRLERGQATVELALVLTVVVLLLMILIQAALVAKDQLLVQHAAREAARSAVVDPDAAVARRAAEGASNLDRHRLTVSLSGGGERGDRTTARVSYRSPTDVPLVGRLIGDVTVSGSVTMRVE